MNDINNNNVVVHTWYDVDRPSEFRVTVIGDTHIGNRSAERYEKGLRDKIKEIAEKENNYLIFMGDACEFINVRDKRFDPQSIASFISVADLVDVAGVEVERFMDIIAPVAEKGKVLGVIMGNHEDAIARYTERDVYSEIVSKVKKLGGVDEGRRLGLGMCGWVVLKFYASPQGKKMAGSSVVVINAHHGFTGGKLAGGKALNMQRWLWTHECDIALMGHSHDTKVMPESVMVVNYNKKEPRQEMKTRLGCITGNWLGLARYAENKGYFPCPVGYIDIDIRPRAAEGFDRIKGTARFI